MIYLKLKVNIRYFFIIHFYKFWVFIHKLADKKLKQIYYKQLEYYPDVPHLLTGSTKLYWPEFIKGNFIAKISFLRLDEEEKLKRQVINSLYYGNTKGA